MASAQMRLDIERLMDVLYAVMAAGLTAMILATYYDTSWHFRDEGYFAHIAERMLSGEVLHRDIHVQHTGLIHFLHAFAFKIFGYDLVSLRIFPALATWIQSAIVYWLVFDRGRVTALAAALAFTALAFPQFPTPTQNWTNLFVLVLIIAVLMKWPGLSWRKIMVLGALTGIVFALRQPTGVFVAMAVSVACFAQHNALLERIGMPASRRYITPAIFIIFAMGLGYYLVGNADIVSILIFGIGPIGVLVLAAFSFRVGDADALRIAGLLLAGAILPLLPLAAYQIATGSVVQWIENSILSALYLSSLPYVGAKSYALYILGGPFAAISKPGLISIAMGALWPSLFLIAAVLSVSLLLRTYRTQLSDRIGLVLLMAGFYAIVAVHHPNKDYFFYAVPPLALAALLLVRPKFQNAVGTTVVFLSLFLLYFQAAQPFTRGLIGQLTGTRVVTKTVVGVERASLFVSRPEARFQQQMIGYIKRHSQPGDAILALPGDPQVFFLAQRRNPLSSVMPAYGLYDEESTAEALRILKNDPPAVVIHASWLAYNTEWTDKVMATLRCTHELAAEIEWYDIYLPRGRTPASLLIDCSQARVTQ